MLPDGTVNANQTPVVSSLEVRHLNGFLDGRNSIDDGQERMDVVPATGHYCRSEFTNKWEHMLSAIRRSPRIGNVV